MSKLVVAHDCVNANLESLTETYMNKSSEVVDDGLRWFYCGGLGVALVSMGELVAPFCMLEILCIRH